MGNCDEDVHPVKELKELADKWKVDFYSKEFALKIDKSDLWPSYRKRFFYPKLKDLPKGFNTYTLR